MTKPSQSTAACPCRFRHEPWDIRNHERHPRGLHQRLADSRSRGWAQHFRAAGLVSAPGIQAAWDEEIASRLAALDRGEMPYF